MTTPLVLYIIAAVIILIGETIAAVAKISGATLSEYVKNWRDEVLTVWYAVPWFTAHFLFAGEPRAEEHAMMILVSSTLLLLTIAARYIPYVTLGWRTKLIFALLGAFTGFLTPIP